MAKYSGNVPTKERTAMKTTEERSVTHEGAPAFVKDAHTQLFTLAVTSMTNENSFYESAKARDSRLRGLVHQLAKEDPEFIQKLVPWLRGTANMRSAPLVIAAEYALAGGPERRRVIDSAMQRADEPAEFIGYYMARTGRKTLPGGIQRGVADAVQRLYNEYAALKYDSQRHDIRMGDVINLAHPKPQAEWQGALYKYLLDQRHHGDGKASEPLEMIVFRQALQIIPESKRREFARSEQAQEHFSKAGVTWEWLSGWLPGGMDAEAWEMAIPNMGYMALLRNLRNFDEAKVSNEVKAQVAARIGDPAQVAGSRQFPYRFWSAWNASKNMTWGPALEAALDASTKNIPGFEGSTLILIDQSASMNATVSAKSKISRMEVGALFGAALFAKNPKNARTIVWGTTSREIKLAPGGSVLVNMQGLAQDHGTGWGTNLAGAVQNHYQGEDRIVVFTDLQTHDGGASGKAKFVHYFDLGGYANMPDRTKDGVFLYGGFTDSTFRQMYLHELTRTSNWDDILV